MILHTKYVRYLVSGDMQAELLNEFANCISDNIPPQIKNLNMIIPILMHFCGFV